MHNYFQIENLCVHYGQSQALFDVSLDVPERGVVAILGRNGAGKTTLLKAIAGELLASSGTISMDQRDLHGIPPEARARGGIGYVPQERDVFAAMTVGENLRIGKIANHLERDGFDQVLQLFPRLGERLNQKAGTLSGGERKMLAISRALLAKPRLLMLDEPTEGVWHGVVDEISACLRLLSERMAIVIVEQNIRMALALADGCYVLDRGMVALKGRGSELVGDPRLDRLLVP